ncbi:MAG: 6,7-dimethyl-8-ribityllumazine synthase [Alphaproteobacteria bacterium]|nr:6,7-dimethyl-8-ribityllumazine synthase [Alphaproteobacteria bacterium]
MARVIEGQLVDPGGRFAIVAARFNELIVSRLVDGALGTFRRHGIDPDARVDVIWVPGAFELPLACDAAAGSGAYVGMCALGAVIRGATPHFEHVAGEASKGVANVSLKHGLPVIFGVLTVNTIEQAIERAGTKAGNAGSHAAASAIEMASLLATLGR